MIEFLSSFSLAEKLVMALVANVLLDIWAVKRLFRAYVFCTHMDKVKRAHSNTLPPLVWVLSFDTGIGGALLDFYCQLSFTKYFLDLPREMTLSQRMTRYWKGEDGWRRRIVGRIKDETLIDAFDRRGQHIG